MKEQQKIELQTRLLFCPSCLEPVVVHEHTKTFECKCGARGSVADLLSTAGKDERRQLASLGLRF